MNIQHFLDNKIQTIKNLRFEMQCLHEQPSKKNVPIDLNISIIIKMQIGKYSIFINEATI